MTTPKPWYERAAEAVELRVKEVQGALPTLEPAWRRRLQAAQRTLHRADGVLDTLWRARNGSTLDRVMAGASIAGQVIDYLTPEVPPHQVLRDMGYTPLETGIGAFLCETIQHAPNVTAEIEAHDDTEQGATLLFWTVAGTDLPPRAIAAVYARGQFESGPYLLGDQALGPVVQTAAWPTPNMVLVRRGRRREEAAPFALAPMDPTLVYIGSPDAAWYADRLAMYQGERRTVRLVGPSGVGKSTLARLLGRGMVGEAARTLRVSAAVANRLNPNDVIDLAKYLAPDVFVLDDFSVDYEAYGHDQDTDALGFLEALHEQVTLTVLTHMRTDRGAHEAHVERRRGFRPGRIDETFTIKAPTATVRKALITHFYGGCDLGCGACEPCTGALAHYKVTPEILDDMVHRTEDLTGAYLRELVGRLKRFGLTTYKSEVKKIQDEAEEDEADHPAVPARRAVAVKRRRGLYGRRQPRVPLNPDGTPNLHPTKGMKLDRMREWLLERGLDTTGRRAALVARIEAEVARQKVTP